MGFKVRSTTSSTRDSQRSRVYRWERAAVAREHWQPVFETVGDAQAWADAVWRRERGRMGLAGVRAPDFERPHRGQRHALAYTWGHRITLPRWARSRWVVLHELAHLLAPHSPAHGPRFVGALIGLGSRWLDLDAQQLMRSADEHGVTYWVRTIGSVPLHGPSWHALRALQRSGHGCTLMELQCSLAIEDGLDFKPAQVRGAALHLVATGQARWFRSRLHVIQAPDDLAAAMPVQDSSSRSAPRPRGVALPQEVFAWDS
jgi:putative metallohydrolase (TIGR04338 family)